MKYKSYLNEGVKGGKIGKAKVILFGFVLILAFLFLGAKVEMVNAMSTEIVGTKFDKNNDGTILEEDVKDEGGNVTAKAESFLKVDLISGTGKLTFIQGNGKDDEVAIMFDVSDFPGDATSFMIVESERSDSSSLADADRYSKDPVTGDWMASSKNVTKNGLTGSVSFFTGEDGKINASIVYRLRKGSFGMKFFKIYFYKAEESESNPSYQYDVNYVIAQPIDLVNQSDSNCDAKSATEICIGYDADGATSRISKELKIYLPTSVAYNFNVVPVEWVYNAAINNEVVNNYSAVVAGSTIYAINYFNEAADGTVTPTTNKETAQRSYMYTNFSKSGVDSQGKTVEYVGTYNSNYTLCMDMTPNEIDYILTKVDSIGAYVYFIRDIFGNIKEIVQAVTNVKNRAIITGVKKGNADDEGYGADETFTNESVKIELTMTVETHFEFGVCLNNKCTDVINLTKDDVKQVKYWRVDVVIGEGGYDRDAYQEGDIPSKDYAHEKYAVDGSMKNIYCKTTEYCTGAEVFVSSKINAEDGFGFYSFEGNVLAMYIGVNGRYRYYIEDIYGNNSWGVDADRLEEEYRNPRVEVYAIDKAAPELTFEVDNVDAKTGFKSFDIETYNYYTALELQAIEGAFIYDGRITDTTEAIEGNIASQIYYPIVRDAGRSVDVRYVDNDSILMSKVRVSEYVYYYDGTKDLYADYSAYDRVSNQYVKKLYGAGYYDNSIATIFKNTKHNSNGLKLVNSAFEFKEINYYHNDYSVSDKTTVCEQIGSIAGYEGYASKSKLDCVNYYLDHGVDFVIEFVVEDYVGNIGKGYVYVNVVDTTPPGFTLHEVEVDGTKVIDVTKLVKSSNVGTDCRMEIGQEIGNGKVQSAASLLNCYNVDLTATVSDDNKYNFEDNVYKESENEGLSFANRINDMSHVKLSILSDRKDANEDYVWVDLKTQTFIPNKTGYYDLKIEIFDNTVGASGTNSLTLLVSYYVDRKIVLIEPVATDKFYGNNDPTLNYCVYIDLDNHYEIRFSDNPYSNPTIFTKIYCTNQTEDEINTGKNKLFQQNVNSDFYGLLSRLESSWYNNNLATPINLTGSTVGVENNYVGLYRLILGTLNIKLKSDGSTADDDYIVKIHPTYRDDTKYSNTGSATENDNLITNKPLEDDDKFSQSSVDFTIKQVVLNVSAAGGNKNYGQLDTNYGSYNTDEAESKYLNGFNVGSVEGLVNDGGQYNDTVSIILGVLRREIGENVGLYKICNYRGVDNNDNSLEELNNMYLDCIDLTSSGVSFNEDTDDFDGYTYSNGIMVIDGDFVKSRALYVETNKKAAGRTLNVTADARNNNYANYVINYTEGEYIINAIDLVVQAAPGQRREYNYTNTYDPNPWEIILYGLVDGTIKRVEGIEGAVVEFNGYTADIIEGDYYGADPNEKDTAGGSEASKTPANYSETRTNWYLYHNGVRLDGYKTNQTYQLLRNTSSGSTAGSAKLVRETGKDGGWYLYYSLGKDLNVLSSGSNGTTVSNIAVITNGREQCSYDATGHIVSVNGEVLCKNYNLIYNPFYTNEDGYTINTKTEEMPATDFVYKSNGKSCLTLDPELPCVNTDGDGQRIYKIQFEIYRREIILEFNSAIETINLSNTLGFDVFYGKRYNFYKTNYFDISFYDSYNAKTENINKLYPEDYLFLCYQNETTMARAEFNPSNPNSTGCTGNYKYGLTSGDSWSNIGIYFKLHELVSADTSNYYDDEDYAIPAGVYYVYSDIAEAQKKNYNYKYLGGSLTIKSLSVEVEITSFAKEYGEKYYSSYGLGSEYNSFTDYASKCMLDGWIINSNTNLINLGENKYCVDSDKDFENSENNVYGFHINGLDSKDKIKDNFNGRPNRNRSVSDNDDTNGLQDNVGTYIVKKGTIATINNNPFINATNACLTQTVKGNYGDCVIVSGKPINNYVISGETRTYSFDMKTEVEEEKDVDVATPISNIIEGRLFILPATLTITVTGSQTKMYGCSYNTVNTSNTSSSYVYSTGYTNCVESDGDYYDLGYEYTVSGDKDYQIARNGFDYTSSNTYQVSGIVGSETFRPTVANYGIKAHALNNGTLYRIPDTTENRAKVKMSSYVDAAFKSQKGRDGTSKKYQGQTVGNYILTLGNVDATENTNLVTYTNTCDSNNMPGVGDDYKYACKNYDINYYGTKVYDADEDKDQTYIKGTEFPSEILFTITKRTAYVYTKYDQKIYGEADMYNDSSKSVVYLCGDYNMDGLLNDDDNVTIEGGDVVNKDVYYGFCSQEQVDNNKGTDASKHTYVEYGLTRYYTKYNSLAKYPWNGIEGRNDVQTDILTGKLSRKGMNGNAPTTDDIKGFYEYSYEVAKYFGTVHLIGSVAEDNDKFASSYGYDNYLVNYYENGLAVNEKGQNVEDDVDATPIKFEIVLRQIKVALVSFNKVYGEADNVEDYDILVCAPSEDFDFENMKCVNKSATDRHGLSPTHKNEYVNSGLLLQEDFKKDFLVRFKRVLGENVSCGNASSVEFSLVGYFFGEEDEVKNDGLLYEKTLSCMNVTLKDDDGNNYNKSVYETLAYLDQSSSTLPAYNYQVSYITGYVNITPRPILITPDAGQGFVYGDYHDTLIPSITYKDSLVRTAGDGIIQTYGLVHSGVAGSNDGVCLNNINYYNNGTINGTTIGTCFYINDRIDEYNSFNSMSISKYDATSVNPNTGLSSLTTKNFVFGDSYTSESSTRSALDRSLMTDTSARYNRNVGVYTITIGDLRDQSGNYNVSFKTGVTYEITKASVTVAPDSITREDVNGTSQSSQYKIYGEQDKELSFMVTTTYTVTHTHYARYDSNIFKVASNGIDTLLANLDRFVYSTESKAFTKQSDGEYIYLVKGDIVTITGFAYDENGSDTLNYGSGQGGLKNNVDVAVNQGSVTGSSYYDTSCRAVPAQVGCNADRTLSYGEVSRILLGYLYVDNWAQSAGEYNIVSGFKVAVNEFNNSNYSLSVVENVKFTIIPRPVGVQIDNITKTYGQTTDSISCEFVDGAMITPCVTPTGVLITGNELLRNNFTVEHFDGMTKINSILNNYTYEGSTYNNSKLYSQNGTFVNGLVPESQKAYSAYGVAESKTTAQLGVYVSRDEKTTSSAACLYSGDTYGFCEDAGTYYLRFYGYLNSIDNITKNNYQSVFKPASPSYTGLTTSVEKYYYKSYFGYNPNYFVIVLDNDSDETAVTSSQIFASEYPSTSRTTNSGKNYDKILKATGSLTINKKNVALYVNTNYFEEGLEIYYVGQNTNAPELPEVKNTPELNYDQFNGLGSYATADRKEAVSGVNTYGQAIWGDQPKQVRTGDQLKGELAYCNKIITESAYNDLREAGITGDYSCSDLKYNSKKDEVNTNLIGYIPIVRNSETLSIVSETNTAANKDYEQNNYSVRFYPGALRIEEDDIKPVVEVNRDHLYIEANAIGTYMYECVGMQKTTTYSDCNGIGIIGKTESTEGDPILDWLMETNSNYESVIKIDLPVILGCESSSEHECTSSAYFELMYGKAKDGFAGFVPGEENSAVSPFIMQKEDYVNNVGPNSLKELIITLIDWFGVTAYDQGEIRNGEVLEKKFDKYWYLIIEKEGTNGSFDISKVGEYKVHFYSMDNAGNVSAGNMYKTVEGKRVLETDYKNVGTMHIIDTTNPIVGTVNLYNGRVECTVADCTIEDNWVVYEDTYVAYTTFIKYDSEGNASENGNYIDIGAASLVNLSTLKKYSRVSGAGGYGYEEDAAQGKYILVPKGNKARGLKHYSWSNSTTGIHLTITGGSDNSYTVSEFPTKNVKDYSQWQHYYSRDGGITWFLYDRTKGASYLALDSEGTREILIKAVDSGVKITDVASAVSSYTIKYYGAANGNNVTSTMSKYTFVDTTPYDKIIADFNLLTVEEQALQNANRNTAIANVGWKVSVAAENDLVMADELSMALYGIPSVNAAGAYSNYKFYKDRRIAYLDRTSPVISFGENNGEDLYVYEFGCQNYCTIGYDELYAAAIDSYPEGYVSTEILSSAFDKNHSILINHVLFDSTKTQEGTLYQTDYLNVTQEKPSVKSDNGGLGSDGYSMNGKKNGLDIRNVYMEERRYIIHSYDKNDIKNTYDLSRNIPTTDVETAEGYETAENYIYSIIKKNPSDYITLGDYSYTIIYSVFDKAGNESVYIARGVIYADLVPTIEVAEVNNNVEEIEPNSYNLNVEQGADVAEVANNLMVRATTNNQFLTQTIYYNGELVVDNKSFQSNIYDGFTTDVPGIYEITYTLKYMYYGDGGKGEIIEATPVKLTIRVEATAPVVVENVRIDFAPIIMSLGLVISMFAIAWFGIKNKRKI